MPRLNTALHTCLMITALGLYVYLGACRAVPDNIRRLQNEAHSQGDADVSVLAVYEAALANAEKPLFPLHEHLIWRGHNPGLFRLGAVCFVKAGVRSLYGLQMVGLALTTATLLLFYILIHALFRDRWIGAASMAYIAFCPAFAAYATSLHVESWGRCLFMGACVAYIYALRKPSTPLLALAIGLYYLACWNHWFWFVIAPLFLAGIHYAERGRAITWRLAVLAVAPIAALAGFFAMMVARYGGAAQAFRNLVGVASFRILDAPIAGRYASNWSEPGKYLNAGAMARYLELIDARIERWYYLSPGTLAIMLAIVLVYRVQKWRDVYPPRSRDYSVFVFWLPAAFAWHAIMWQATIIHEYSAAYHWPVVAAIFGCFVIEVPRCVYRYLDCQPFRRTVAVLVLVPVLVPVLAGILAEVGGRHATDAERIAQTETETPP